MSKRARLAQLCREQRDQAFATAYELRSYSSYAEGNRVLNKCAVLLGVLAVMLDDEPTSQNGKAIYTREGRAFVKVKR